MVCVGFASLIAIKVGGSVARIVSINFGMSMKVVGNDIVVNE
jgi:hypothetical protein